MPDPTTTYRLTTAAAPAWAAAGKGDARDAEIRRLREQLDYAQEQTARRLIELAAAKAEIERLRSDAAHRDQVIARYELDRASMRVAAVERNNEIAGLREDYGDACTDRLSLRRELADLKAECCRLTCRNGDLEAELVVQRDAILWLKRSAQLIIARTCRNKVDKLTIMQYLGPEIRRLRDALAALAKAKEDQ